MKYCSFEERLAAQRREREMATAELGFKKPLSKEEKIDKKKQRLAAIGKSLIMNILLNNCILIAITKLMTFLLFDILYHVKNQFGSIRNLFLYLLK